jgi:hypothetical protein
MPAKKAKATPPSESTATPAPSVSESAPSSSSKNEADPSVVLSARPSTTADSGLSLVSL